jgi:hypothetical protein
VSAELIERLKTATTPDDALDEDILLACGWVIEVDDAHEEMHWLDPAGCAWSRMQLPRPTHSLDAALTLVPEGWSWRVGNLPSRRAFADLGTQRSLQCIEGATPAIALCVGALRARAGAD